MTTLCGRVISFAGQNMRVDSRRTYRGDCNLSRLFTASENDILPSKPRRQQQALSSEMVLLW